MALRKYFYSGPNRLKYFLLLTLPIVVLIVTFGLLSGLFLIWVSYKYFSGNLPTWFGALLGIVIAMIVHERFIAKKWMEIINNMGAKDAQFTDIPTDFIFTDEGFRKNSRYGYSVTPWSAVDMVLVNKKYVMFVCGHFAHLLALNVIGDKAAQENFVSDLKSKVKKIEYLYA